MVGLPLMMLLGWAVGQGSTSLDDWFQAHGGAAGPLLFFTDYRTIMVILAAAVALAVRRRRWLLAVSSVLTPLLAVVLERLCKVWFGRWKGEGLSYPSGHTTVLVVALGMLILVGGARVWLVAGSVVFALLGVLGQAATYHYFTDAVGAVLLGTSLACLAATVVDALSRPRRESR